MSKRLAFDARTIGDHYPGIGRYAYGVWQALGQRVACTLVDPQLRNTRFKLTGVTRPSVGVRSPWAQIDIPLKLRDANLYYSPYYLMPYMVPCDCVLTLYDTIPIEAPEVPALTKFLYRFTHRLAGQVAKRIIVLSESAKNDLTDLGVPREKMYVCYMGLEAKFYPRPASEIEQVRHKYHLPDEFWLCLGSSKRHKNIAAAHEIKLRILERRLIITGEDIPSIAEEDLPAVYAAAQVFVFPSRHEGLGMPILEAMACGTPVVCLPAPGAKEAAGDAAVMAEEMSTAALVEAAATLIDPQLRAEKRRRGLEWIKHFTWEKTLQAIGS